MEMFGAMRARLLAAGPVTALVGQRVTWIDRPQASALPAITLQVVSELRPQHMAGFDGLRDVTVQIDIWGNSYVETKSIMEAVIAALTPAQTGNGINFARSFIDSIRDLGEQVETQFIHRTSIDLRVHYSTV